ncbi:non-specific lipid-transfer protein-like [Aristolochia californica]|uniref:non-specific lipid-transfer protein-like n=1 Tax=Aristolochia californica TaxID=171875 RepID=UPI0035E226D1
MAPIAVRSVACFLLLSVFFAPYAEAAITCGQVVNALTPCLGYLRSGRPISRGCCTGVQKIKAAASTPADRKTACSCLKSAAAGSSGINFGLAAGLPSVCKVRIPFKISPSTDCSK